MATSTYIISYIYFSSCLSLKGLGREEKKKEKYGRPRRSWTELTCIIKNTRMERSTLFSSGWFRRGTSSGTLRARHLLHVISGFRRGDFETWTLLGFYAAQNSGKLSPFRHNLSVQSTRINCSSIKYEEFFRYLRKAFSQEPLFHVVSYLVNWFFRYLVVFSVSWLADRLVI